MDVDEVLKKYSGKIDTEVIGKEINNRTSFPIYQGKNFRKFISVDIIVC